jgi:hypothetical protein
MVADLSIYMVVHQPRRVKLPAQPVPRRASIPDIYHCLFDERMNERYFHKVARTCYYPAARMFLALEPYLPARLIRQARRKNATRVPRRRAIPEMPESDFLARRGQ